MGLCQENCYSSNSANTCFLNDAYVGEIKENTIMIIEDEELNPNGRIPISEIKGWYNKNTFVEGLQISYGGKTNGPHTSVEADHPNKGNSSLLLQYGEYITHITGKILINQIYEITFHTNKDNHCQIGNGKQGTSFELKAPGKCVSRIKFGYIKNEGISYLSVKFIDPRKLHSF